MSFLNVVKGLVAQAERAAAQVKTGAVVSRQATKIALPAAELQIAPAGHFGGVFFREVSNLTAAGMRVAMAARTTASERADRSTDRAESRTAITGGSTKYLPVRKGGGAGKTGRAGAVPQVMTEGPTASVAKENVVKRVKKDVPAGIGWRLSQMVGEVSATVAKAKAIIALAKTMSAHGLAMVAGVGEAKAIVAEAPSVYRYLARKARAVVASIREVAV